MTRALALACTDANEPMKPWSFERRTLRDDDVHIEITHCGICHSDIHQAHNDWGMATYPLVPGHEIVGVVKEVGSKVTKFKAGDRVGVGCMVDSCRECASCREGEEQFCEKGMTQTYADKDRRDGSTTYGGYSDRILVREEFVLRIPTGWTAPRPRRSCAPASRPTRRSGIGASRKARRSASSASAGSATWR